MVSASALFVVALGAFGALGSASPLASRATCYKGVYILAARGTGDPPNDPTNRKSTGQPGMVANMINASISDSAVVAVEYRATANFDYDASVVEGINDAKSKVQAYVDTCGSASRVVLLGWSQGGNVMTDLLAGGSKPNQPAVLAEKYRKNIVGVAVFGDPSFTVNQTFDAGTNARGDANWRIFGTPREGKSLEHLNTYAKVLRSYCDKGDQFCAGINNANFTVHNVTVAKYAQNATNFIVKLAQK